MDDRRAPAPADVELAAARLDGRVTRTPLMLAPELARRTGTAVAIKAEHAQITGSFKYRGALNKLIDLDDDVRQRGVVTASSGNHGIAVSAAARRLGVGCTVVVPTGASEAKLTRVGRAGAELIVVDSNDTYRAETHARELAERSGRAYVSPYDDEAVIAGQGTIGIEIMDQVAELGWPGVDAIVVATGGGGMISGIATAVAGRARIVGAQPENDAVMTRSVAAGHVVAIDARPTLSDGTAGGVDPDTITFASCRELVDEWITVSEAEIGAGVRHMIDHHSTLVEGASGVALAAAARLVSRRPVARIVVVSCGANISSTTLTRALDLATGPLATGGGQ